MEHNAPREEGLKNSGPTKRKETLMQMADRVHDALEDTVVLTEDELTLFARREAGEISPHDFDLNFLFQLNEAGAPLRRADVGNQAVVLSRADFEQLGYLTIIHSTGEEMTIEPESMKNDVMILFPEDLG